MSIWEYIRSEMGYINYIQLKMESAMVMACHEHPDIRKPWGHGVYKSLWIDDYLGATQAVGFKMTDSPFVKNGL